MSDPRQQCAKCPWKVLTDPNEIPGYDADKHRALRSTIQGSTMMGCHETPVGAHLPCVGWLSHQLGPGNNLGLRLRVMSGQISGSFDLDGPQHQSFSDTLPDASSPL